MRYQAIVIGASAGGIEAIGSIISKLPKGFMAPILVVQHLASSSDSYMCEYLNGISELCVKEAEEKEKILPGFVYTAPPNYHLMVENDETLSLSVEPRVNYSRPSIDVLFETAADTYESRLIGVVLTGANNDGSKGAKCIKDHGGLIIVQNPNTSEVSSMPMAALMETEVDFILSIEKIGLKLVELAGEKYVQSKKY